MEDHVDFFLASSDSLKLTRLARASPDLELVPAGGSHIQSAGQDPIDLALLRKTLPEDLAGFNPACPLSLTFFSRASRCNSKSIKPHALLAKLPEDSFYEVRHADGTAWETDGKTARLFVECAGLACVRMSLRLVKLVKSERMSKNAAFARLLELPMELCGSYARDAINPATADCAYGLAPMTTADELRKYLDEAQGLHGAKLARRAATYAQDGSGSVREALVSLVLRLPPRLGGAPFPQIVQNEPIEWPEEAQGIVHHKAMRPDIRFVDRGVAIEVKGRVHMDVGSFEEDHFRDQDYASVNIVAIPATNADLKDAQSLERFLLVVANKLVPEEDEGFLPRIRRALDDPEASYAREVLISQFLPPLPGKEND